MIVRLRKTRVLNLIMSYSKRPNVSELCTCFLGDIMQTKDLSNASKEAKTDQNVDLYCNITRRHARNWSNRDSDDFRGLCRQMLAQSPRHGRLQRSNGTLRRKTSIHRAFKQVTRKVLEKFGSNRPSARHHFLVPSSKVWLFFSGQFSLSGHKRPTHCLSDLLFF